MPAARGSPAGPNLRGHWGVAGGEGGAAHAAAFQTCRAVMHSARLLLLWAPPPCPHPFETAPVVLRRPCSLARKGEAGQRCQRHGWRQHSASRTGLLEQPVPLPAAHVRTCRARADACIRGAVDRVAQDVLHEAHVVGHHCGSGGGGRRSGGEVAGGQLASGERTPVGTTAEAAPTREAALQASKKEIRSLPHACTPAQAQVQPS